MWWSKKEDSLDELYIKLEMEESLTNSEKTIVEILKKEREELLAHNSSLQLKIEEIESYLTLVVTQLKNNNSLLGLIFVGFVLWAFFS